MVTDLFELTRDASELDVNFRVNGRGIKQERYKEYQNNLSLYFCETYIVHGWDHRRNWRILTTATTQGE